MTEAVVCVSTGDDIEVLWKITRTMDDEDVVENKWWPAKVDCRLPGGQTDAQGRDLWRIIYDEVDEFAAETRSVSFVGEHELIDCTSGDEMAWRRQGDDWDQGDMDDDENMVASDQMYTASELASIIDNQVRDASGGASEEEVMRTLQDTVPPQQLLQGASAMRDFIDKFKEHMSKTLAASRADEPVVITKAMIDEFTKSLHSK